MKRIFKIDERVWFEDDHMNGWGTIALVGGERRYPEYPVSEEVITIAKESGGEIETTPDRVWQLSPYAFQGYATCWEHNETDDDYPLFCPERQENCFFFECDHDDFLLTANKTPQEILAYHRSVYLPTESIMREMCRKYASRVLMDTDEEHPMELDITVEPEWSFGMSSLEMPHINAAWQDPGSGCIYFNEEFITARDIDFYSIHELVQIVKQL